MYAVRLLSITILISLVSSAFLATRDGSYNITVSTTSPASSSPKAPYVFSNTTSAQQCQVAVTSWVTTIVTVASTFEYVSSSAPSTTTTSSTSRNTLLAVKRSIMSTTQPASDLPTTTTSVNVNSALSEFASIYSVLTQYEHNATANSSTATAAGSFNTSLFNVPTPTSASNSSITTNATSVSPTCASSCQNCTTVIYYVTTTIIATTPTPFPVAILPPITVGNATYTPTGTYYVIDNSTLSPGGLAILVSNSTLLSLSPSGTQLVIAPLSSTAGGPGPSTYDLSPAPASSPPVTTATPTPASTSTSILSKADTVIEIVPTTIIGPYNLSIVVFPSKPIIIASNTITPGAAAVTISRTPVSLAPSSDFLVVGSSTITLARATITSVISSTLAPTPSLQVKVGSLIWSGIGGAESGTVTKTTTSAVATFTSNNTTYIGQAFTGAGALARPRGFASLWVRLGWGLGLGLGLPLAGVLL